MSKRDELIVGLDIGTTKICAIVAEETENGIDIVGIGTHPSRGLRKGVVVDIDATVRSIKHAVEEAELMADCEITQVYAGIAGGHIRAFNSHGVVAVKDREVCEGDVKRVIDAAKAVAIPMDREVIHVIPQEFIIDDQDGIREPLGMSGVRLEAKIHIVTAAVASAQNIVKCCNKAGLNVVDIVLEPLASAAAVLADDERDLGVCMIDIGGGTTDIAVIALNGMVARTSIKVGGDRMNEAVIQDIKKKHNMLIGEQAAEAIKISIGSAHTYGFEDEEIEVRGRDLIEGIPKTARVSSAEIRQALREPVDEIIRGVKRTLEDTPPELAADIARYLNDEPVVAAPPSATYRARKFVRRRKKTVLAVLVIAFLVVAGSAGTGRGWWRTRKANERLEVALAEKKQALVDEEGQRKLAELNAERALAAEVTARSEATSLTSFCQAPTMAGRSSRMARTTTARPSPT